MESIERYHRSLQRKNYSSVTWKNYLNRIERFVLWLNAPLADTTHTTIGCYVDYLLRKRLCPKTIACHLQTLHVFFEYLIDEEHMPLTNPVRRVSIRLPKPLPRCLKDNEIEKLLAVIKDPRDTAIFMLMLRSGLRVQEVAHLTLDAVDYGRRQICVYNGKGARDRVAYVSDDALHALEAYLKKRSSKAKGLFLVQKGPLTGTSISVRGIQKRIEYYAKKSGLKASCHRLRHTFATQLLNADADLATIQDLLGHEHITTTQRYCRVANLKVQRDYYKAMETVLKKTQIEQDMRIHVHTGRQVIPLHPPEDAGYESIKANEGEKQWRTVRRTKRN